MPWPRKIATAKPHERPPPDGFTHRHKVRGTWYRIIGVARAQCSQIPIKDGDMLTLYQAEDGTYSVRPPAEFNDGRFERVTKPMKENDKLE